MVWWYDILLTLIFKDIVECSEVQNRNDSDNIPYTSDIFLVSILILDSLQNLPGKSRGDACRIFKWAYCFVLLEGQHRREACRWAWEQRIVGKYINYIGCVTCNMIIYLHSRIVLWHDLSIRCRFVLLEGLIQQRRDVCHQRWAWQQRLFRKYINYIGCLTCKTIVYVLFCGPVAWFIDKL